MLYFKFIRWFFKKVYRRIDVTNKFWTKRGVLSWLARKWNDWNSFFLGYLFVLPCNVYKDGFIVRNINVERINMTDKIKLVIAKSKMLGYTSEALASALGLDYVSDYKPLEGIDGISRFRNSVFQYESHILAMFKDSQGRACCIDCLLDNIVVYRLNLSAFEFVIGKHPFDEPKHIGIRLMDTRFEIFVHCLDGYTTWIGFNILENLVKVPTKLVIYC